MQQMKLYLFRLKKLIVRSTSLDYLENYNSDEIKVIDMLDDYAYILKNSSDERLNIKYNLYDSNIISEKDKSWNRFEELQARYKFFGIILGIIDGKIQSKFTEDDDSLYLKKLFILRKKIISVYNEIKFEKNTDFLDIVITNFSYEKDFVDKQLRYQPKYKDFNQSYYLGMTMINKINFEKIYHVFNNILESLIRHETYNKEYEKTKAER